jgi:cytochrome b561
MPAAFGLNGSMRMAGDDEYGPLAKWLHWLVALLVFFLIPAGLVMARLDPGETQDRLFVLHESFGLTALALMILRVANRWRTRPSPAPSLSATERAVSIVVHRALYVLLIVTPLIGWFALSAFGLGPSFFWIGEGPAPLAKNEDLAKSLFQLHLAGAVLIGALALLHIAAALAHARKRDGVVSRMSLLRAPE